MLITQPFFRYTNFIKTGLKFDLIIQKKGNKRILDSSADVRINCEIRQG